MGWAMFSTSEVLDAAAASASDANITRVTYLDLLCAAIDESWARGAQHVAKSRLQSRRRRTLSSRCVSHTVLQCEAANIAL